jgi:hypothetical protein
MLTLTVPEAQLVEWVQQLSPANKRKVLRALIPALDDYEALVAYGSERVRAIAAERGLNWEMLTDPQREELVDAILHEQ